MKRYQDLKESSLSKIISYIQSYDTGTITAYRNKYNHKENEQRNKSLQAHLASRAYIIISVKGSYIEDYGTPDAVEVGEHVFFCVDHLKTGKLKRVLEVLGEKFDQDSVLYIPKGGEKSILIGTNKTGYPGYKVEKTFPILHIGKNDNEFLTKVKGRPFYFREGLKIISETYCGNNAGRYLANLESKKDWKDIEI
jgi:hypothetical protein